MNPTIKQVLSVSILFLALSAQAVADTLVGANNSFMLVECADTDLGCVWQREVEGRDSYALPNDPVIEEQHAPTPDEHQGFGCTTDTDCTRLIEPDDDDTDVAAMTRGERQAYIHGLFSTKG